MIKTDELEMQDFTTLVRHLETRGWKIMPEKFRGHYAREASEGLMILGINEIPLPKQKTSCFSLCYLSRKNKANA